MARSSQDICMRSKAASSRVRLIALAALAASSFAIWAFAFAQGAAPTSAAVLKVCADPNNLPQSDDKSAGYENKLAEALAHDLDRKIEYTYFPQRMGFVRNTLNGRNDATGEFKCDLIIGVPKGYELAATTQPYMHSTYALIVPARVKIGKLNDAEDLMKLPKEQLQKLRYGIFARTPATDWLLRNGLIDRATLYAPQSGDPGEHPAGIVERDLAKGDIDVAIVWGPVAGFLADRHQGADGWAVVPFKPDPTIRFDYEMSMGVRFADKEWKSTLDQWIGAHKPQIDKILVSYRVPLLETPAPR